MAAPAISRIVAETLRQTITYPTDIITTWNGLESRVALSSLPREALQVTSVLADADMRALRAQLFKDPTSPVLLPLRHEDAPALAAITTTAASIDTTLLDWPDSGGGWKVLIENAAGQSYLANITSVTGYPSSSTSLTLDVIPPAGQSYPAGSRIIPVVPVYLDDGQTSGRYPVNAGSFQIQGGMQAFRATIGTGATITTFDGKAVFDRLLNADQAAQESTVARLQTLDYGNAFYTRWSFTIADLQRRHAFKIKSAAERLWYRKFLHTVRGRQVPWLLPTWKPDLVLNAQPLSGATSILVTSPPDYVTYWWPSLAHRHLQLNHADGTVTYVTVSAAVDNGNGTQTLTVTSVGGMTSPIASISLLEQVRFDNSAGEFTIDWRSKIGDTSFAAMVIQR